MSKTWTRINTEFLQMYDQIEALNDLTITELLRHKETAEMIDDWLRELAVRRRQAVENQDLVQASFTMFTTMGIISGLKRFLERRLEEEQSKNE